MMDQITRNMKTKGVSEQRAVQAWELMSNGWTETEFERRLNQVKIQDRYPEIKEIVAKMGRVADANGKDRLTIASVLISPGFFSITSHPLPLARCTFLNPSR